MRVVLLAALALVLACVVLAVYAKAYTCALPDSGHEFRQFPCGSEDTGEVQIDDPTVSKRAAASTAPDAADAGAMVGDWCEFAVSITEHSEKALDNIHWYFGPDYVTYVHSRALKPVGVEPPKYPLRRAGSDFHVDDPMFGGGDAAWTVLGRREGVILVEGPMGRIMHMRPGRC